MKSVVITIDKPATGDILFVEYSGARGGCTKSEVTIPPAATVATIAHAIAQDINANWLKEAFSAKVNDKGALIIGCSDLVADVKFKVYVEGKGGTTAEIMEF